MLLALNVKGTEQNLKDYLIGKACNKLKIVCLDPIIGA